MRIRLHNELLPLNILAILLVSVIAFFPENPLRIVLGLPFVLFFPGYALVSALFPKKDALGRIVRVALSFGLSLTVVPLIGFILNFTPFGIRLYPTLISLALFTLAMSLVAWFRRHHLPETERFQVDLNISFFLGQGERWADKALTICLLVAMLMAVGTLVYAVATPKVGEKFTEFYILGPEGEAEGYLRLLKVDETGTVIIGIVNHEHQTVNYWLEIRMNGERVTAQLEGQETERVGPITLNHEEKWEGQIGFRAREVGDSQKVEFWLYKEVMDLPYRSLYLWIDVS